MKKNELFIYPLHLGNITSFEKSLLTLRRNFGVKIEPPCISWMILGGDKNVLVDTGPADPKWSSQYHYPLRRTSSQRIDVALGKLGISLRDIDMVILTHLHWDHCYNLELFPNASFYVQRAELEYAVAPLIPDRRAYEAGIPGVKPPWMKVFDRLIPLDGDEEIVPGIRVIQLLGHTPGLQGVIVETGEGPWLLPGDTVPLYENVDGDDNGDLIPSGLFVNLNDYFASLRKLEPFRKRMLPSHDGKVLKQERYPFA